MRQGRRRLWVGVRVPNMMTTPADAAPQHPPGFASRRAAADLLEGVLRRTGRSMSSSTEGMLVTACDELPSVTGPWRAVSWPRRLRRLGTLRRLVGELLNRGLPENAPRVESALLTGAAQILFLDIPHHAAVDLSVRLVQGDRRHARYAGLVNAVLRRIARNGIGATRQVDRSVSTPPNGCSPGGTKAYGEDTARAIAHANSLEPPLDLTVKSDPDQWAERLHGRKLPTGSVRLVPHGPISALPGYAEGSWWVQDAAAALPARLFGDLHGRAVADLLRRPRRQDRATGARRRHGHGRRSLGAPHGAACARTCSGPALRCGPWWRRRRNGRSRGNVRRRAG